MPPPATQNPQSGAEPTSFDLESCVTNLANAVAKGMSRELEDSDISPIDFALLLNCMQRGECTATELAALLPVDPSRISRVVARLVDKGWLQRRRKRNDRRLVMLQLTTQGAEVMSDLRDRVGAYNTRLTASVSEEEFRVFKSVAFKIIANGSALELQ